MENNKNYQDKKNFQDIHCDVCNCKYNNNASCSAKQISIGPNYAISSADTICSTFKPSDK